MQRLGIFVRFGVWGLEFKVRVGGLRARGSYFAVRVWGLRWGFRVKGLNSGLGAEVQGLQLFWVSFGISGCVPFNAAARSTTSNCVASCVNMISIASVMSAIIIIKVVSTAAATAMIAFVVLTAHIIITIKNNSSKSNNNKNNNNNNSNSNNTSNSNSSNNKNKKKSNSNNNNGNSNNNLFAWLPSAKHIRLRVLGCPDSQMSSVFWWLNPVRLCSLYRILYPKRRI